MQVTTDYKKQREPKEKTEQLASRTQYIIIKAQLAGNMVFDGHAQTAEERIPMNAGSYVVRSNVSSNRAKRMRFQSC